MLEQTQYMSSVSKYQRTSGIVLKQIPCLFKVSVLCKVINKEVKLKHFSPKCVVQE